VARPDLLADELMAARAAGRATVTPPSAREGGFDLTAAYAVEGELMRRRRAEGRATVGVKVGYANKAMWRALKLDTLVWAHMYDDTVQYADGGRASLSCGAMIAPKIEPEIVFRMSAPIPAGTTDAAAVLAHVEWIALGFEIIDCVYPGWTFQPADFVAAFGLHAALVVGTPLRVTEAQIPGLVEALAAFKVSLLIRNDVVAEGAGRNSLRSPALCLAELAAASERRPGATPLAPGDLVSSGTLTDSRLIHPGEQWTAEVAGIGLDPLTLDIAP
jgi:2-oxo-3-hexenedioate decarboxylase